MKQILMQLVERRVQYRVRREVTLNLVKHTPEVKGSGLFASWQQIVKVYDRYYLLEIPDQHLTHTECVDHIEKFKKQLIAEEEAQSVSISYTYI